MEFHPNASLLSGSLRDQDERTIGHIEIESLIDATSKYECEKIREYSPITVGCNNISLNKMRLRFVW